MPVFFSTPTVGLKRLFPREWHTDSDNMIMNFIKKMVSLAILRLCAIAAAMFMPVIMYLRHSMFGYIFSRCSVPLFFGPSRVYVQTLRCLAKLPWMSSWEQKALIYSILMFCWWLRNNYTWLVESVEGNRFSSYLKAYLW